MRVLVLLRPTIARFAPSAASASAATNPMPLVAPVIRIIVYTTMFIVLINTMVGVAHIAPNKLRAAACLGATPFKSFLHVTLPARLQIAHLLRCGSRVLARPGRP